uniref:TfiI methylase n=1 Tax=Thermus filiformis TaxID=276 RepID=Q9F8S1_THEFI|nr:TfiI restriction endonuclease [Thermus filiformis]
MSAKESAPEKFVLDSYIEHLKEHFQAALSETKSSVENNLRKNLENKRKQWPYSLLLGERELRYLTITSSLESKLGSSLEKAIRDFVKRHLAHWQVPEESGKKGSGRKKKPDLVIIDTEGERKTVYVFELKVGGNMDNTKIPGEISKLKNVANNVRQEITDCQNLEAYLAILVDDQTVVSRIKNSASSEGVKVIGGREFWGMLFSVKDNGMLDYVEEKVKDAYKRAAQEVKFSNLFEPNP